VETVVATVRVPHREPAYQGPGNPTLPDQLADALRDGPFHRALALAVEVSGLSLQRLQHRLADAGVHLSTTTLSYWRTGRSRPERPDSLRGVQVLEPVLGLPPGALASLLGPRRPRGRWVRPEPGVVRLEQLLPMANVAASLARQLDIPQVMELERVSCEDRLWVGPDRTVRRIMVRQVLRAVGDRVTRSFLLQHGEHSVRAPSLVWTRYCRVGRVRTDHDARFMGAELILDRVLTPGDTTIVEYELDTAYCADAHFERSFRTGGYQHILQVQFDPAAVPTRCLSYRRAGPEAPHEDLQDAWINQELVAHVARVELEPGLYGMRWEWD
jgi:hypothetical protein